jgi:hypothetical protein
MSFSDRVGARAESGARMLATRWLGSPGAPAVPGILPVPCTPRRDRAWVALVGNVDVMLRRWHGVYEFTDDPDCLLRVGLRRAYATVRLADGQVVAAGSPIGVLHFWNEHLPPFPPGGPDIRWAKRIEHRFDRSMRALAAHVEGNPAWVEVRALHGNVALAGGLRPAQMRRVANHYGFEIAAPDLAGLAVLHDFGENFLLWAFARAFNPGALHRQPFRRARTELWMSRETLRTRFLDAAGNS